jgi:hypothetical protein
MTDISHVAVTGQEDQAPLMIREITNREDQTPLMTIREATNREGQTLSILHRIVLYSN